MKLIFKVISKSLHEVNGGEPRGGVHNWEKYFIALFHVSEHVDHFKAIKYFREKKREIVWSGGTPPCLVKYQTISRFFLKASLR